MINKRLICIFSIVLILLNISGCQKVKDMNVFKKENVENEEEVEEIYEDISYEIQNYFLDNDISLKPMFQEDVNEIVTQEYTIEATNILALKSKDYFVIAIKYKENIDFEIELEYETVIKDKELYILNVGEYYDDILNIINKK